MKTKIKKISLDYKTTDYKTTRLTLKQRLIGFFDIREIHSRKRVLYWGIVFSVFTWLFWGIPLPTKLATSNFPVSTKLFDRNDKLIYEIYADQKRSPISISEVPQHVKNATVAIEDKDFYKHYGFSPTGIARAAFNIVFKRKLEGGSTLTQQLVKNALLTPERTVRRKIREFALTMFVEAIYSKNQILEMYLNQVPYGSTAYGIEAASELYLGKPAKDLNLAEASFLAGLPASPSRYSPFGAHPELAKERQTAVLRRMVEDRYITQDEADSASKFELKFAQKEENTSATHFALWIKSQLSDKYGEKLVEQGGLRVKTTLDLELQEVAQNEVATEVAKLKKQNVGNGSTIVIKPDTGEILAMVGSKDYFATDEDGKVNITLAKRQPGSSIKPLNYALALRDKKITPSTMLADIPTCFGIAGQPLYCPTNYDGSFHGAVGVRFALGNSYNIPAVRTLALNGVEKFVEFARNLGISTFTDPKNYGLSLTLGGGEVRPIEMAEAYGVFANEGIRQSPISILEVKDWKGKVYEEIKPEDLALTGERVLNPNVTFLISHILLDNNARAGAFGERSFLNVAGHPEVSVKTGTTNDRRDNWTIGYTKYAVVVVWVGNNDNEPMSGAVSGVSGASPIWNKVMKKVLDRAEDGSYDKKADGHAWPQQPEDVIGKNVCVATGLGTPGPAENPGCPSRFEYFLKENIPDTDTGLRQDLQIDKRVGQIAAKDTPPEFIEMQNHPIIIDPLGSIVCLDCPVASTSATIRL